MNILITGAGGQLGRDLLRVLGQTYACTPLTRQELDICDIRAVQKTVNELKPDVVINAAGYSKVDQAEENSAEAYRINALGVSQLAIAAEEAGAKLVHVSTDYVFDGTKGEPYGETDRTNPLNIYGKSKLLGEQFVRAVCPRHFIVRTSWLYSNCGNNFVTKILSQAENQQDIKVVDDQFGSPTYTLDLAECIGRLITTERYGTYHVSNSGCCSRYDFAKEILQNAGYDLLPTRTKSADFVLPAPRPQHSALSHHVLEINGFPHMRNWKTALEDFLSTDWVHPDLSRGGIPHE
ncbi:dTDP-4-dehydrorhamnose reductase [Paenibacillus montanisoli]|uniref:dTDP-4-dehydrorhamnose reductase n=1 Tax=Paenibacillus montanisoli TaxID=2081970 RepID=A0A328U4Q9_9BACL|nr:dTDP-4-dehydrorhamnose reductase [Paenibacillus montanisoli]RAP76803.1 dTDP-4-dehydrorhamnose reductase [Paenibacillus montanisoli]